MFSERLEGFVHGFNRDIRVLHEPAHTSEGADVRYRALNAQFPTRVAPTLARSVPQRK